MSLEDVVTHCLYCGGNLSRHAIRHDRPMHRSCAKTLLRLDIDLDDERGRESGGSLPFDGEEEV